MRAQPVPNNFVGRQPSSAFLIGVGVASVTESVKSKFTKAPPFVVILSTESLWGRSSYIQLYPTGIERHLFFVFSPLLWFRTIYSIISTSPDFRPCCLCVSVITATFLVFCYMLNLRHHNSPSVLTLSLSERFMCRALVRICLRARSAASLFCSACRARFPFFLFGTTPLVSFYVIRGACRPTAHVTRRLGANTPDRRSTVLLSNSVSLLLHVRPPRNYI